MNFFGFSTEIYFDMKMFALTRRAIGLSLGFVFVLKDETFGAIDPAV